MKRENLSLKDGRLVHHILQGNQKSEATSIGPRPPEPLGDDKDTYKKLSERGWA